MMFLQYAVWGAWAPVLWPYLTDALHFKQTAAGWVFATLWLACLVAPSIGGQLVDRRVATERFLAFAHLAGGAALIVLAVAAPTTFAPWMLLMSLHALCYAPTLALSNSIVFHHAPAERFGAIRVYGTLGWIASGLVLTAWRRGWLPAVPGADSITLAGACSIVLGLYCLTLPHTPPSRSTEPLAVRRAFALLRDRNTLAFLIIAFVVTTELQFYYGPTAGFLESELGISHAAIPTAMAVAQVAEILAMAFLLPIALRRLGLRTTLAIGVIAWPARYIVFALAPLGPLEVMRPLVIASLALHGVGFTFFFVASQIFMDRVAPTDIRASAQALLTLVTLGIGNFLGTLFTARVLELCTSDAGIDWTLVFAVPCGLTVAAAVAFLAIVREPTAGPRASASS